MKPVFATLSALLALSVIAGCAPETKSSTSTNSEAQTNKQSVLAHDSSTTNASTTSAAGGQDAAAATQMVKGKPKDFEGKGAYFTATSVELPRFKTMLAAMKAAGGNMIVFDGKDEDGIVSWKSNVPLAKKINAFKEGPIQGDLKAKVELAHKYGIHVAARVCCFHDPILAKARPDLAPRDVNGGIWKELGRQAWVDPSKPEAQQYVIDLAKELASYGVDEVQWDYVRFPAMGKTQNARYAYDMKAKEKHDIITEFVTKAYNEVKPTGVLISADVYGVMAWAKPIDIKITGQLLEDIAPHVDVLCPMVYPSHFNDGFDGIARPVDMPYTFVHRGVELMQKKVKGSGVTVRPWLQAMPYRVSNFGPHYITEQVRAAKDGKAIGWLMWNAQNRYDTAWAGVKAFKN